MWPLNEGGMYDAWGTTGAELSVVLETGEMVGKAGNEGGGANGEGKRRTPYGEMREAMESSKSVESVRQAGRRRTSDGCDLRLHRRN